ncbi:MAG: hypothetical protein RL701_2474, partial [Pseudomonadota bacterium]
MSALPGRCLKRTRRTSWLWLGALVLGLGPSAHAQDNAPPAPQPSAADALPPEPPPAATAGAAPATTSAPAAPSFLDTTDRRVRETRAAPNKTEVGALNELESEVGRFTKIGGSYRDTLDALLRREYLRKRYSQDQNYARQVKTEEDLEDKSRLSAIALFERFIAKYPNDPKYTPDAMFRLGELYFERDSIAQQNALEAFMATRDKQIAAGAPAESMVEPTKDFNSTIALYRRLVQGFAEYPRLDGVYYLIGYCLNEMGNTNEARLAWLNLVCGNHYHYTGEALPNDLPDDPNAERSALHPALTLEPKAA